MTDQPVEELQLIQRILKRDETALSELYTQYGTQVFSVAMYVLHNRALADEAAQDTFLKIWNTAQRWDIKRGQLRVWILTIARYTAIDILRRNKNQNVEFNSDLDETLSIIGNSQSGEYDGLDDSAHLKTLIATLSNDQIEAIELAFFQGMTHNEIAAHLNEPLGTIKSRIRSGLQALRTLLLKDG